MKLDGQSLELETFKEIELDSHKISTNAVLNYVLNSILVSVEKALKINRNNLRISESRFNSPIQTRFEINNYGKVIKYEPEVKTDSAIVVIPQRGGGYNFAQLASLYLATTGFTAYEIQIPLRGERLPSGYRSISQLPLSLNDLKIMVTQAITETNGIIETIPEKNIGICGISLGAIYSSIAYGINENINSAALILGGGQLAEMIMNSKDSFARAFKKIVEEKNISLEELKYELEDIEPCNNVCKYKAKNLLMITAKFDKDIPEKYGNLLMNAWGNPKNYSLNTGHLTIVKDLYKILPIIKHHFVETLL